MADKPIPFQPPMIRALLAGTKTQTRRALTGAWQSALEGHDRVKTWFAPPEVPREGITNEWAQSGIWAEKNGPRGYNRFLGFAPYRPGDRLWVREAWRTGAGFDDLPPRDIPKGAHVAFEADTDRSRLTGRLRPAMFMPRALSRITLIVQAVKVERLQEISRGDAMLEGCPFPNMAAGPNPRDWYRDLWSGINPKAPWEANPWVAAYTFRVIRSNIDQVPA